MESHEPVQHVGGVRRRAGARRARPGGAVPRGGRRARLAVLLAGAGRARAHARHARRARRARAPPVGAAGRLLRAGGLWTAAARARRARAAHAAL